MKRYLKPETTVFTIETDMGLMAASEGISLNVDSDAVNNVDRSKNHTFSVWGEDDEEE